MKMLACFVLAYSFALFSTVDAQADLIISQYVETNSGSTPKGIELWNTMATAIDFSVTNLDVQKGTNGGVPASDFTLSTGSLGAGEVMVIGTSDMGTYLAGEGLGSVQYHLEGFTFNGDDSLVIKLGGITQDTFGDPGSDPGSSWSGGGVSSQNSNIALKSGLTVGDTDGWTNPSERFELVSSDPAGTGGLSGFGVAPATSAVPEPSAFLFGGLVCSMLGMNFLRRRRQDA